MSDAEHPIDRDQGVSAAGERRWGVRGGVAGTAVGLGGFLVAWLAQGEPLADMLGFGTPAFMRRRDFLAIDGYFIGVGAVGLVCLAAALYHLRSSRHPRTDGYGAGLLGTIFVALAGSILAYRFWVVTH